jgi:outer membrane protein OmpA-like peptidoglycan-associated protein
MLLRLFIVLFSLIPLTGCLSSRLNQQFTDENKRLRADSLAQENRIRKLLDEKEYLEHKNATTEQALNLRLQEKEDSLNAKEKQLKEREASLMDMKSRKEQEAESFRALAQFVFNEFKDFSPADYMSRTNCTQIILEINDRALFASNPIKPDIRTQNTLLRVKEILLKNTDLQLLIVAHTDTFNHTKEKIVNLNDLGFIKARTLAEQLCTEYGISQQRIIPASKGATIKPAQNSPSGRNRVEFIFYSNLLPCIHSKE